MSEYASKGLGGTALGFGIGGAALSLMNNGGLGGLFGGCGNGCGNSAYVTRYDAEKDAKISQLEVAVALRDASTYTMTEMGKLRDYVDRRFEGVNAAANAQAVVNAQVAANLSCMQGNIATLMALTKTAIPIDNICPAPMPQYNSWTAPTATT